jgi:hypothetical protein
MSRTMQIVFLTLAVIAAAVAGQLQTTVSVKDLPPEDVPAGNCRADEHGYLGIGKEGNVRETKFTDKQIGEYVRIRLDQGYSIALYPQASGKIYVIGTCHSR